MEKYLTGVGMYQLAQWAVGYFGWKDEDYREVLDRLHPIGSYYWSSEPTDPGNLFGGNWEPVSGYYMYATNSNGTGGSNSVTLTENHMPSHTHSFSNGSHYHTVGSHNHSFTSHTHGLSQTSHYHTISHKHNVQMVGVGDKAAGIVSGDGWHYFERAGTFSGAKVSLHDATATFTISDKATTTDKESSSYTLSNDGGGTSGPSSPTTTGSCSSSGANIPLDPPYINAYCWYRTG